MNSSPARAKAVWATLCALAALLALHYAAGADLVRAAVVVIFAVPALTPYLKASMFTKVLLVGWGILAALCWWAFILQDSRGQESADDGRLLVNQTLFSLAVVFALWAGGKVIAWAAKPALNQKK